MLTIGRHLIAEYYGCPSSVLDDREQVRAAMLRAAERIGATVVGETFHQFAPQGVSGTVVIAESHLSIHTWPERGYVSVDIYTCGGLDPRIGVDSLAEDLGAESGRIQEIVRGLPEELESDPSGDRTLHAHDVQIVTRLDVEIFGQPVATGSAEFGTDEFGPTKFPATDFDSGTR